jgi:hypothetical protein
MDPSTPSDTSALVLDVINALQTIFSSTTTTNGAYAELIRIINDRKLADTISVSPATISVSVSPAKILPNTPPLSAADKHHPATIPVSLVSPVTPDVGIDRYLQQYTLDDHEIDVGRKVITTRTKEPVPRYITIFLDYIEFNKYLGVYFDRYSKIEDYKTPEANAMSAKCLERAIRVQTLVRKFLTPQNIQTTFKSTLRIGTASKYAEMVKENGNEGDVTAVCRLMAAFIDKIVVKEQERATKETPAIEAVDYHALKAILDSSSSSSSSDATADKPPPATPKTLSTEPSAPSSSSSSFLSRIRKSVTKNRVAPSSDVGPDAAQVLSPAPRNRFTSKNQDNLPSARVSRRRNRNHAINNAVPDWLKNFTRKNRDTPPDAAGDVPLDAAPLLDDDDALAHAAASDSAPIVSASHLAAPVKKFRWPTHVPAAAAPLSVAPPPASRRRAVVHSASNASSVSP